MKDQPTSEAASQFWSDMHKTAWLMRGTTGFRPGVDCDEDSLEEEDDSEQQRAEDIGDQQREEG